MRSRAGTGACAASWRCPGCRAAVHTPAGGADDPAGVSFDRLCLPGSDDHYRPPRRNDASPPAGGNCNDSAARCSHSDRLIFEETQHGPIHRRLSVRQRPNCGVGTPIPGRPLSLSRLPQASWGAFSRFRGVPSGCGDDRWRNTRLRRAVFLSPLRLLRFRTQRRRNRSEPRIPGCPWPTDANLRKLDRPSRVLVAAVSAHETIRPRS